MGVISAWDQMSSGANFARGRRVRRGMRKGNIVKDGKLRIRREDQFDKERMS